jgi:SAM-dependent methyltransferase
LSVDPATGPRLHARCPGCGALERHRLQYLVLDEALKDVDTRQMSMLHAVPEKFFVDRLRGVFGHYVTTGFEGDNVDFRFNLTKIPFPDNTFDVFFASHVLENVANDLRAMAEVYRILKPGGFAFLPVPIIGPKTIEYLEPNPFEEGNVRCPGEDYFERLRSVFSMVKVYGSEDFPQKHQLFCYEDRSHWPKTMPLRPKVKGSKHADHVPVCFK